MHVPALSSHKKVQLLRAAVSKQPPRSPARTSPYGEKRRLRYHKVNGKKVQNPDGKYAASWEERYHKKRHFHHFSDDDDDAPTV